MVADYLKLQDNGLIIKRHLRVVFAPHLPSSSCVFYVDASGVHGYKDNTGDFGWLHGGSTRFSALLTCIKRTWKFLPILKVFSQEGPLKWGLVEWTSQKGYYQRPFMEVSHRTSTRKRPEIRTKWRHKSYLPEVTNMNC